MNDSTDGLDIPEFLRVTADTPRAPWKAPKKAREARTRRHPFHLPRSIEPAGWALLKALEGERKQRQAARFAALKALPKLSAAQRRAKKRR